MKNETLKKWAIKKVNASFKECVNRAKNCETTKEFYPTKEKLLDAWFIKERFTKKELKELSSKSYEQILKANTKKVVESYKKTMEQTKSKIEKICISNVPDFINVSVEWFKSRTWGVSFSSGVGFNCHESIITNSGYYRVTARNSGKMYNTYNFEKKSKGGKKNV